MNQVKEEETITVEPEITTEENKEIPTTLMDVAEKIETTEKSIDADETTKIILENTTNGEMATTDKTLITTVMEGLTTDISTDMTTTESSTDETSTFETTTFEFEDRLDAKVIATLVG